MNQGCSKHIKNQTTKSKQTNLHFDGRLPGELWLAAPPTFLSSLVPEENVWEYGTDFYGLHVSK